MQLVIGGTTLYYVVEGDGVPFVLLHGNSVDHHLMYGSYEPIFLQKSGYKRIYFDLPGMGKTVRGPEIVSDMDTMELIIKAIDLLIGDQKFLLAGESFGGHVARGIVERIPDRILGVCYLCPWISDQVQNIPERERRIVDSEFLASLPKERAQGFDYLAVVENKDAYERFEKDIEPYLCMADYEFINHRPTKQWFYVQNRYEFPTLFIEARQDNAVGYEGAFRLLSCYPKASFAVIDCAGHNMQIERVPIFQELVKEWLERVEWDMK